MGKFYVCTSVTTDTDYLFDGLGDGTNIYPGGGFRVPGCADESNCYKLSLNKIDYDVRLYSPGFLYLTFSLTSIGKPDKSLKPYLLVRNAYLDWNVDVFGYNTDTAEGNEKQWILKNYFVKDIRFRKESSDQDKTECVFLCRSIDYILTVKKGCQVFTAQKFAQEIFMPEVCEAAKDASVSLKCDVPDPNVPATVCRRLLNLGYDSGRTVEGRFAKDGKHQMRDEDGNLVFSNESPVLEPGPSDELIHPYLVRYNESLYDFLARVAHRCGEFLYFDDGKLCLGLPVDTVKHIVDGSGAPVESPLCTYPEIIREPEKDAPFSMDYAEGKVTVGDESIDTDLQHSSDDYLHRVTSEDDLTRDDLWNSMVKTDILSPVLKCDRIVDGLVNALIELGLDLARLLVKVPDILKNVYGDYTLDDKQFAADLQDNLTNRFYHTVESLESRAEKDKVLMNFQDKIHPYHPGCDICLNDGMYDVYVVVRMYGSVSSSGAVHYAEGVPVYGGKIGTVEDTVSRVVVPPRGSISHYRKATSMEAIVKETDDPLRLNRVRVKYFWQNDDSLSPWIRVVVPFTGGPEENGGCTMKLAPEEHVVLNYTAGNIERPYVNGSFYFRYRDGDNVLPCSPYKGYNDNEERYWLPKYKTRSIVSGNGHSLKFKDIEDTSLIGQALPIVNTFYNMVNLKSFISDREFQNIPFGTIKGGGLTLSDYSELCSMDLNADRRTIDIRSNFGSIKTEAFTGITVNVPNGDVMIKGKNIRIEAGNNLTLSSGANIHRERVKYADTLGLLTGQLLMDTAATAVRTFSGIKLKNALDLSFVRCFLEIILRPVEGSLTLNSGRNMTVTAGKGKVRIPSKFLSTDPNSNTNSGYLVGKGGTHCYTNFNTLPVISAISTSLVAIESFYEAAAGMYKRLNDCAVCFQEEFPTSINHNNVIDWVQYPGADLVRDIPIEKYIEASTKTQLLSIEKMFEDAEAAGPEEEKRRNQEYRQISKIYDKLCAAVRAYQSEILSLALLDRTLKKNLSPYGYSVETRNFPDDFQHPYSIENNSDRIWWYNPKNEGRIKNEVEKRMNVLKRSAIIQILIQCKTVKLLRDDNKFVNCQRLPHGYKETTVERIDQVDERYVLGDSQDYPWTDVASSIEDRKEKSPVQHSFLKSSIKGAASTLGGGYDYSPQTGQWKMVPGLQKLLNINGSSGPRAFSEVSTRGNIFFSNSPGNSLTINNEHEGWIKSSNGDARALADGILKLGL